MTRILIVEDDRKLNDGICLALKHEGYEFLPCKNLKQARQNWKEKKVSLVLLDLNLPDGNGMEFLTEIRKESKVPIIILTANDMETDIVTGLELGADDYITKPFSLMVLRARVGVQLRKLEEDRGKKQIQIDQFSFDFEKMKFLVQDKSVELSKTEQRLLQVLIKNKGLTMSRSQLIDLVWNGDLEYVDEHALTVTIKRLRDKLGDDASNPTYIKTVYGIGYVWAVN